jgi:hypothetical protein
MRHTVQSIDCCLVPIGATLAVALLAVATLFMSPEAAFAGESNKSTAPGRAASAGPAQSGSDTGTGNGAACTCPPGAANPGPAAGQNAPPAETPPADRLWPKPSFADLGKSQLDDNDAVAALEAIHIGLTDVADGASYVWHRGNGRLSGAVSPTQSFKDAKGQVCRHVVISLSSGLTHKRNEVIACRTAGGVWNMAG